MPLGVSLNSLQFDHRIAHLSSQRIEAAIDPGAILNLEREPSGIVVASGKRRTNDCTMTLLFGAPSAKRPSCSNALSMTKSGGITPSPASMPMR